MVEQLINPLQVSWGVWFATLGCAFINGFSKSGIKGIGMVTIPILAYMYGGMASAGILLPFLVFGDLFAFRFYRESINWTIVRGLLPWALAGVTGAVLVGTLISDDVFRSIMAIAVLACLSLVVILDLAGITPDFSKSSILKGTTGVAGGFATMIGNAAGPIFDLYLLSTGLQKRSFLGTGALFFLVLNITKVPLHMIFWGSITKQTLQMNLVMVPAVFLGALVGQKIVRYIPELTFRYLVVVIIALSSLLLLVR